MSGLQWTTDAYLLVVACLLILLGSCADRFGRRRVFQLGLAAFSLGSLLCSLAPSLGWLVAFRGSQAVGGSMLNPVAMSIIANTFTDHAERARAIEVRGSVAGLSLASTAGFVHASHTAWAMLAAWGVTITLLGIISTGHWALQTAERNRARLTTNTDPVPEGERIR